MEVLDEFDSEIPLSVTFCQRISEEDFERQAATYTKRALRRLFRSIDRNPKLAERVVRKGKQAECERRGLLSFLWAKFFCAVQGELNYCNCVGAGEMHRRLEQLKRSIYRAHLCSQDAKKRRKRKLKKPEPILLRDRSTSPCLPLPRPATTMASEMEKLEVSKSEVKFNCTGLSSNPRSRMVDLTPLDVSPGSFHFPNLAAGNSVHELSCPGFPRTSACSGIRNTKETPSPPVKGSVFKPPVLLKVQPVPRPKGDLENNPGSTESVP